MLKDLQIPLFDLVTCVSDTMDLVSSAVSNHHKQVAYIAFNIGREMGFTQEQLNELVFAGILHDIGAVSYQERLDALQFEIEQPHHHAEWGYRILKSFEPLTHIADIIRFHHVPWKHGRGREFKGIEVPLSSHILHLSDRIAVSINRDQEVLGQVKNVYDKVVEKSGDVFVPELVEAFKSISGREYFWLDTISPSITYVLKNRVNFDSLLLDMEGIISLTNIFRRIIDFRSRFTSTHSSGVAASAEALAKLCGFSERECQMMRIAGYLHDLGKLAVPVEILEKPGRLTKEEFRIIKSHTFFTYRVLENLKDFEVINEWAAFHHERLDGSGYPFHLKGHDLSLGSRILAVADVFTAITEDRPYREGMASHSVLKVLNDMVLQMALDGNVVSVLEKHIEEVNHIRISAQLASVEEYKQMYDQLEETQEKPNVQGAMP